MGVWLSLLLCVACELGYAQHGSRSGFRSPLDIPLNLSGNFGEFRTNHFHTGLDVKTQGREGLRVFAVTGGCVSRIRVGPYGYGNALYLDHPNGYTSVYAHLSEFNSAIAEYVMTAQYDLESWDVDLHLPPNTLCVDSSAVIALSGNSGSSGGPHLHFEIRETQTEFPVNPLLWDFPVVDSRAPLVKGVQLTPLSDSSQVMGTQRSQLFETRESTGQVALQRSSPIEVSGPFGIGIHTLDLLDGNANVCGIYRIVVAVDGEKVFEQVIDKLDFAINRQLNAHADYRLLRSEKKSIHRTFVLPDNRLPIYRTIRGSGAIHLNRGHEALITVEVSDVHGNTTVLRFKVKDTGFRGAPEAEVLPEGAVLFAYDRPNTLRTDSCSMFMPEGRLYEDTRVWIARPSGRQAAFSPHYEVGNSFNPVHDTFLLRIRTRQVPEALTEKVLVVHYDSEKRRYSPRGGHWSHGEISVRVREFGEYAVAIDTLPPTIKVLRADRNRLEYRITDNLSGIDHIEARVDGRWVRMHYDPKRNLIWHNAAEDGIIDRASKQVVLRVTDERGNSAIEVNNL